MHARTAMTVGTPLMTPRLSSDADSMSLPALATMVAMNLKLKEQTLNVVENKGPAWKSIRTMPVCL
jgi:hypothetical protein